MMQIMNATEEDKDELLALYHTMIGGPCEWSETYPDENTIAFDLKNEDLFVIGRTFKAVRQEGYAGTGNRKADDELCR